MSELLRSGEFLEQKVPQNGMTTTLGDEARQPKAISLKSLREALVLKKLKEKKESAKLPDVKIPSNHI